MFKRGKIEKTIRPSERKSITEFSVTFGSGMSYDERVKTKRIVSAVLAAAAILLFVAAGYFITDVLLKITELPYSPTVV